MISKSSVNELAYMALSLGALFSGLLAACLSQVSSSDYRSLFAVVAALTTICLLFAGASWFFRPGHGRFVLFLLLAVCILAFAATVELAARLVGIRLLG